MDDFDELVQQFRAGAEKRSLRLLEAEFPKKPDVIFRYETTSVDEVLDVAQQSFAPFVSLTVSRLEPVELVESWSEKDFFSEGPSEPPAELFGLWEERAGQVDGVFVEWVSAGARRTSSWPCRPRNTSLKDCVTAGLKTGMPGGLMSTGLC